MGVYIEVARRESADSNGIVNFNYNRELTERHFRNGSCETKVEFYDDGAKTQAQLLRIKVRDVFMPEVENRFQATHRRHNFFKMGNSQIAINGKQFRPLAYQSRHA
jgi:hypothetical protein